ncbi:MAG: FkbM family methyltransferase [Bacteroidota bacterium]
MGLKDFVRSVLTFLRLDITKNLQYDRLTLRILRDVLKPGSNCIDIGCHKGEILQVMVDLAPNGRHYAFEPIPAMYNDLVTRFAGKATIFPYALSNEPGQVKFKHVTNAPAYSGIRQREYAVASPEIEEIDVEVKTLDELIPATERIDLVKIDVEGAEFGVLKGAVETLRRNRPVVVFECGLGASNYYGTQPGELFDFMTGEVQLKISTLKNFTSKKLPMSREAFIRCYEQKEEYYFVAHS